MRHKLTPRRALFLCPDTSTMGVGAYTGGGSVTKNDDWYNNKELYEMMVSLSKRLEATDAELAKTQTLIRDYNGLRERLGKCESGLRDMCGHSQGGREMWGYVVGGVGVVLALISYAVR